MGTLRSASDCRGMEVNGVTLGDSTFTDTIANGVDSLFAWDDSQLPNGLIQDDGTIIIDELEVI